MSGVPVPADVPNAAPLQPLLTTGPYGTKIAARSRETPADRIATNVGRRLG